MEKKPSLLWSDYLTANKTISGAVKNSYDIWLNKYVKPKNAAPKEKVSDKDLIPGKMYTFAYLGKEKINEEKQFIDHRPVMISLGRVEKNGKLFESGIDLNVIPPKVRLMIMDRIYKIYKSIIEQNERNLNGGKSGKKALPINYAIASKLLDKTGWQSAYMMFERSKMGQLQIIDYSDWPAMSVIYTKAIRGKQIKEILAEYIKRMAAKNKEEQ